jgi:hypothetical protein
LDLVQACKRRKKKTIVLKLDFQKAFDTVSWDSLLTILQVRGFDAKWTRWIQMLTTTAKTAILLNGIPGPWISIKRGLRQGDPLSPLLFIKFADEGLLKHPVVPNLPCPVIQYADDTLILIQGDDNQARLLKEILEASSKSTGLAINYAKSTFVPLNLDEAEQMQISNILGCPIATFPQTYLGLPLSDSKLPRWALQPLLQMMDVRIDMLSISGASSGG